MKRATDDNPVKQWFVWKEGGGEFTPPVDFTRTS